MSKALSDSLRCAQSIFSRSQWAVVACSLTIFRSPHFDGAQRPRSNQNHTLRTEVVIPTGNTTKHHDSTSCSFIAAQRPVASFVLVAPTMDGLSSAAGVLAVVDMSAKVASLLFRYSKEVGNAKEDIAQVQLQVESLKNASESVQQRLNSPDGARLEASKDLLAALRHGCSQLESLEQRLHPSKGRKAMSRFGARALKWPFDSKDIEKTIQHLSTCTQAISLALQADQLCAVLPFSIPPRLTRFAIGPSYSQSIEG
jgi:hypothetical protein